MNLSTARHFALLFSLCLIFILSQTGFAADEWRTVSPEELARKTPKVEPNADAEAIFWEVRIDDSSAAELAYNHYVRVKIFTERGRERFSKLDIPFLKGKKVRDVSARVVKPDGTIIELKKEDVFEKEIVRASGVKIKAKSFAVSGIEPGVILEYRYRETFQNDSASDERLIFQRDIPIETASYYVRPYEGQNLRYEQFNMPADVKFVKDKKGYSVVTMTNVPSFKAEPRMPPEDQVRSWILLYYTPINTKNALVNSMVYWSLYTSRYSNAYKDWTKPNGEIKKAAAEITQGAATDDEKLKKLYEFVQTQIKNNSYDASLTDDARKKLPKNKNAGDTFKNKMGAAADVDILFASLATALGYETALTMTGDRSEFFFKIENARGSFVHIACVAVKTGANWKYFNPGTAYLPYGMLAWNEEDSTALVVGEKGFYVSQTPLSDYSKSKSNRRGKFKLLEDGTLEGSVTIEYDGHQASIRRQNGIADTATKREDDLKDEVKNKISTSEVSDIKIDNFTDVSKPLVYSYKIRVPGYAQKTGKRIFLQPGFFEYGAKPEFSGTTRVHPIFFSYPWAENDQIEIQLPAGFALDSADSPGLIADKDSIGSLSISMKTNTEETLLIYDRKFHFGGKGNILFPATAYQPIKTMFDAFQKADAHTVTLKQK